MPGSQSWLGSPDPPAPNAPEQSQPHHRDWGQHCPQDSPPGAGLGVYSVLARGFAVPQTSLEGDTAQLEGTMPQGHCPVLSPPSSLEPPSPRDLPRWDQEDPWAHSGLVTPKNAASPQVCSLAGLQHGKWGPLWGLRDTGKSGCHTTSDICDLLCTELGLFPCKPSCSPSKAHFLELSLP